MTLINRAGNSFALLTLGALLVVANGCDSEQAGTTTKPAASSPTRAIEDIKNDVKPPVVIKPDAAPARGTAPAPR